MKRVLMVVLTLALALLVVLVASCGPAATPTPTPKAAAPTPTPTPKIEVLKIGVVGPLSGPGAPWGNALVEGVKLAAEHIKAGQSVFGTFSPGIRVGDTIYMPKVVEADDMYTGKGGVDAANRLIYEEKVKFIIGPISSASAIAMAPITEKEKVLRLINTYAKESIGPDNPYTFRIVMTSHEYAPAIYPYIVKRHPEIKTVAVISPNDASGISVSKDCVAAAKTNGLRVVADEYYERGTVDFYPLATRLMAKKPDMIDTGAAPTGDAGLLLKVLNEMGWKGVKFTTTGVDPIPLIKIAGAEAAQGYYSPSLDYRSPLVPETVKKISEEAIKMFGHYDPVTGAFYPPLLLLKEAIEYAQSLDTTAVMKALERSGYRFDWFLGPKTAIFGSGPGEFYGIKRQIYGDVGVSMVKGDMLEVLDMIPLDKVAAEVKKMEAFKE